MDKGKGSKSFGERSLLRGALGFNVGGRRAMGRLDVQAELWESSAARNALREDDARQDLS